MGKSSKWLHFLGGHPACSRCRLCVEFTGVGPDNASEAMIKEIVGNRTSVALHWLEERIFDSLYREELRRGAGATDISLWAPTVLGKESARVLGEMRPEFGLIKEDLKARQK